MEWEQDLVEDKLFKPGLYAFKEIHAYFIRISDESMKTKLRQVQNPQQAASEGKVHEVIREWEKDLKELIDFKKAQCSDDHFDEEKFFDTDQRYIALRSIACGELHKRMTYYWDHPKSLEEFETYKRKIVSMGRIRI